jgi:CRISPR/Cas system-associated exonuclease Cas4 (RecB family)
MLYSPYSYSKLDTYKGCPLKFKFRYIDKIFPKVDQTHLEKGKFVHFLIETYPKWDYSKYECSISEELKKYYCEKLKEQCSIGELKKILNLPTLGLEVPFGLDEKLKPTNYYDSDRVLGGYIDRLSLGDNCLIITDYKTGKVKEYQYFSNDHQIVLYAVWAFKVFNFDKIIGKYVYVDHDEVREFHFDRKYLANYSKAIGKNIVSIEKEKDFKPNVSVLCNHCEYYLGGYCNKSEN